MDRDAKYLKNLGFPLALFLSLTQHLGDLTARGETKFLRTVPGDAHHLPGCWHQGWAWGNCNSWTCLFLSGWPTCLAADEKSKPWGPWPIQFVHPRSFVWSPLSDREASSGSELSIWMAHSNWGTVGKLNLRVSELYDHDVAVPRFCWQAVGGGRMIIVGQSLSRVLSREQRQVSWVLSIHPLVFTYLTTSPFLKQNSEEGNGEACLLNCASLFPSTILLEIT